MLGQNLFKQVKFSNIHFVNHPFQDACLGYALYNSTEVEQIEDSLITGVLRNAVDDVEVKWSDGYT